jgi:hypothetical protein
MRGLVFLMVLLIIPSIYAECNSTQININSASAEQLDNIKWVGISTAKEIINLRPFSSVDDLIRVDGIAEKRLGEIKAQGLACVIDKRESEVESGNIQENEIDEESAEQDDEENESENSVVNESKPEVLTDEIDEDIGTKDTEKKITLTQTSGQVVKKINPAPIRLGLNSKDIKIDNSNQNSDKTKYVIYGLGIFCILLLSLLYLREHEQRREN